MYGDKAKELAVEQSQLPGGTPQSRVAFSNVASNTRQIASDELITCSTSAVAV